jgi:hypothetical protein
MSCCIRISRLEAEIDAEEEIAELERKQWGQSVDQKQLQSPNIRK